MSSPPYILDASALLCLLFEEQGAEFVAARLPGALVSAANYSEVVAKLVDRGLPPDEIAPLLADLDIELVPVDRAQATDAGLLRAITRAHGLSLGDRAWADLDAGPDAGLTVELVRPA